MIILVDNENVNIAHLKAHYLKPENQIYVSTNPQNLSNACEDYIAELQAENINVRTVMTIKRQNIKNQLDHQLAFYFGMLTQLYPTETYIIASRDNAFKSLLTFATTVNPTIRIKEFEPDNSQELLTSDERTAINNALQKQHVFKPNQHQAFMAFIKKQTRAKIKKNLSKTFPHQAETIEKILQKIL